MEELILKFPEQLTWEPEIIRPEKLPQGEFKVVVSGMGGSHLAADLLAIWQPNIPLIVWSDYGLPPNLSGDELIIISSYSGQTEEAIDGALLASERGFSVVVIASGGRLIEMAEEHQWPYIKLPNDWPPRQTIGFGLKALLSLLGSKEQIEELTALADDLKPMSVAPLGQKIAEQLIDKIPIIYSSQTWSALAYIWKIKFNETGKKVAFYNVLPESNHNELNSFDPETLPVGAENLFSFIMLTDETEDERLLKRFSVLAETNRQLNYPVEEIKLSGDSILSKIFNNLLLIDWIAFYVAEKRHLDPISVPLIEKFKQELNQ